MKKSIPRMIRTCKCFAIVDQGRVRETPLTFTLKQPQIKSTVEGVQIYCGSTVLTISWLKTMIIERLDWRQDI